MLARRCRYWARMLRELRLRGSRGPHDQYREHGDPTGELHHVQRRLKSHSRELELVRSAAGLATVVFGK